MLKGLLSKMFRREYDVDLGPVTFCVSLQEGVNKEDVEAELQEKGIKPYNYLESVRMFFCNAPKKVYEEVFSAKLVRGNPKKRFGNTPEGYVEREKPSIPTYLEGKVEAAILNTICFGTPESLERR